MAQSLYGLMRAQQNKDMLEGALPNKLGASISESDTTGTQGKLNKYSKGQMTQKVFDTPEGIQARIDLVKSIPEYQDALQAEKENQNLLNMMSQVETPDQSSWVKPLAALADSETGSKLLAGYKEPSALDNQTAMLLKYQNKVNEDKQNKYKQLLSEAGGIEKGVNISSEGSGLNYGETTSNVEKADKQVAMVPQKQSVAKAAKLKDIPAKMAQDLGEAYKTPERIDSLIAKIRENPKLMGNISTAENWGKTLLGMESEAAPLDMMIQSLKQDIGKMKEGGVLRKEDELKYSKMLPSLRTNPATAVKNLQLMRSEMAEKVKSHYSGLKSGHYDVSGFDYVNSAVAKPMQSGGLSADKMKRLEELKKKLGK